MALGSLTPTTELEAVNFMLRSVGLSHVNTLSLTGIPKVDIAIQILHEASRKFQKNGWWFNTESEVTLPVDGNGEILIPLNILSLDIEDATVDGIQRGSKLYDKENRTYQWDSSQKVTAIYFLDYEETPEAVREFIKLQATYKYQATTAPDEVILRVSADELTEAYIEVEHEDDDNCVRNSFRQNEGRIFNAIRNRNFNP